eukprot:177419_1
MSSAEHALLQVVDNALLFVQNFTDATQVPKGPIKCVCDGELIKIKDLSAFVVDRGDLFVWCSQCDRRMDLHNSPLSFWHCPQDYNMIHPDGYNVCFKCFTEDTQPNTNEIIPNTNEISCTESIACVTVNNFIKIMKQFREDANKMSQIMDQNAVLSAYNDYMHVLYEHNSSEQYQMIFSALSQCNISNCAMFSRNNRNRMINNRVDIFSGYNYVCCMMDTMHCYIQHPYDVGYRTPLQDEKVVTEQKYDATQLTVNKDIVRLQKRILSKRKTYKNVNIHSNDNYNKYIQLFSEEKDDQKQTVQDNHVETYSFGYRLIYGYEGEKQGEDGYEGEVEAVEVKPAHESFKDELIQNKYATTKLTKEQFDNEYKKTMICFRSNYCKRHKNFQTYTQEYHHKIYQKVEWKLKGEYLLAVMIYCNYTYLQTEFSTTYREKNGKNHQYFYFWGKYLKIFVQQFGTLLSDGKVKRFYHGITEKVYFPQYVNTQQKCGIQINCPLSTSSSLEIAAEFCLNRGLIIELQDNPGNLQNPDISYVYVKYISAEWLSDFPKEKEYLFVQNIGRLGIYNIIDPNSGYEYKCVLEAAMLIYDIVHRAEQAVFNYKGDSHESTIEPLHAFCEAILQNVLSKSMSEYKALTSLSSFSQQILNTMFLQHNVINIHYWRVRGYYSFISKYFVYSEYEWVNLKILNSLFPNIQLIEVSTIRLSDAIFDNILEYFAKNNCSLQKISISGINSNSDISMVEAVQQFTHKCRKLKLCIYQWWMDDAEKHLSIERYEEICFIKRIITEMNKLYFVDLNGEIETKMQILITNWLDVNSNEEEEDQILFNEWCYSFDSVFIDWNHFAQKRNSCLFKIISHNSIQGWVNLNALNTLFPSIEMLLIENGNFSVAIMDSIYNYLENNQTTFTNICIADPVNCEFVMTEAVTQYKQKFELINWKMDYSNIQDSNVLNLQLFA